MDVKKTYQEVFEFSNTGQRWLQQNEEESKFRYAMQKLMRKVSRIINDYQEKVEEMNIKHCLAADEGKGAILRDANNQYQFTKDGLLKRNKDRKALFDQSVTIEPHYVAEIPKTVTPADRDVFVGFVIRDDEKK